MSSVVQPEYVGTKVTAKLLGISRNSVSRSVDNGTFPSGPRRPNGYRQIPLQWILDLLPPGEYQVGDITVTV